MKQMPLRRSWANYVRTSSEEAEKVVADLNVKTVRFGLHAPSVRGCRDRICNPLRLTVQTSRESSPTIEVDSRFEPSSGHKANTYLDPLRVDSTTFRKAIAELNRHA